MSVKLLQRSLTNFDGDILPDNWDFINQTGSGSGAMVDGLDLGFRITTGAITGDWSVIGLANTSGLSRHYDANVGVIILWVSKRNSTIGRQLSGITSNTGGIGTNYARMNNSNSDSFQSLSTKISSTTTVSTTLVPDTNWHIYKILNQGSIPMATLSIDGILEATSTTNVYTGKVTARLSAFANSSTLCTVDFRYCEVYNF